MQNSDLVEILNVLTEEEQKDLLHFLNNSNSIKQECALLLHYLLRCLNQNEQEKMHREAVYEVVFPGKEWVENKLPKLMGETLAHVRRWVAENMALKQMNDLQYLYYLQGFYRDRGLEDKFWSVHQQIASSKDTLHWQTTQDFYTRFLSENDSYLFQSIRNKRKDDLNLKNVIISFNEHYLIGKLWFVCLLLNQNLVAPLNLDFLKETLIHDLAPHFSHQFFTKPLGQLYARAINLLSTEPSDNEPNELREFIKLLRANEKMIPPYCTILFENSACNYCTRCANKGESVYLQILFDLHVGRVNSGRIYINNGMISASELLNTIPLALRLQEFSWAKDFIETHKKKILGVMPSQQYYEFALANYLFHTKDYQETCRILMTSDYEDIQCKISGRILEIKALSERFFREKADHRVGEYLEDRVEAAILFFFRHKNLEATKKKMGKRFADTMKRIINAEGKRDVERLEIIQNDIAKAEYIAERQWLTKLVEDLMGKYKKK